MKQKQSIGVTLRLSRMLGKGGFGEVYLAHPIRSHVDVDGVEYPSSFVLKIICLDACEEENLQDIEKEMTIVSSFHHPHIVSSIDQWLEVGPSKFNNRFCLAMNFCDGGDLEGYIGRLRAQNSPPPLDCLLRVMAHILSALNYSHSKGVIHRDIKPSNVFITSETIPTRGNGGQVLPKVVIGDFGLSRPLNYCTEMVKTRVGTPGYLSPEIILSKPYNFKTDIFSVGVLFYEFMMLERPFWKPYYTHSNSFWATLHTNPGSKLIKSCTGWAGKSICFLVARMLSKNPAQRPTAFEALTAYSARLARIVSQECIEIVSDDVLYTSPASKLAVEEQPSLHLPGIVDVPPAGDSHPDKANGEKVKILDGPQHEKEVKAHADPKCKVLNANQEVSPRRKNTEASTAPSAVNPHLRTVHADPLKASNLQIPAKKGLLKPSPTANAGQRQLVQIEKGKEEKKVAKDNNKKPAREEIQLLKSNDDESDAHSPLPPADRLRQLKHCLIGQPPFTSNFDEALWAEVGYDCYAFILAKIASFNEVGGEGEILSALQTSNECPKRIVHTLHKMMEKNFRMG